jgi:hypothetical protein
VVESECKQDSRWRAANDEDLEGILAEPQRGATFPSSDARVIDKVVDCALLLEGG